MNYTIDKKRLAREINSKMWHNRLSVRNAAEYIGISPATLNRVMHAQMPSLETYYQLCVWLGSSLYDYFIPKKK